MRVPWTARRSSQSILKEISPKYSLKGLMLQLKLQYFGYLMQKADSLGMNLSQLWVIVKDRKACSPWRGWVGGGHKALNTTYRLKSKSISSVQFSRSVMSDSL